MALVSVAKYYLEEEDLPIELRPNITDHIVMVHTTIQQFSKDFEIQLKRKNYSTPKNYLDFLNNYKKLLAANRKKYSDMILRYANGCKTLEKAAADVEVLQAQLEVKQKEVNAEKAEVEAIIEDIQQKTEIASKHQTAAVEKKAQLDVDSKEIEIKQKEADKILSDAIPILKKAELALKQIEINSLVQMKALANPPEPVKIVGIMLLILKPTGTEDEKDGWNGAKIMMNSPSTFIETLKNFGNKISRITQRQIDRIKNYEKNIDAENLPNVSQACAGLYAWVQSTLQFYEVNKHVTPLKTRVEELTKKLQSLRDELKETETLLEKLNKDLKELQENQTKKQVKSSY
jgi:dynein heavy chain